MPYARTQAHLEIQRREPNGRKQRNTTQEGRQRAIEENRRETEAETLSTVLGQPHRREALSSGRLNEKLKERDPRAGYALGRLYLTGQVSAEQLVAGNRYAELYVRHGRQVVGHTPRFPCQSVDGASGIGCGPEPDEDAIAQLRRSWHDAQAALADTGEWADAASALVAVCVMDRDVKSEAQIGSLRVGLNALHRLWN